MTTKPGGNRATAVSTKASAGLDLSGFAAVFGAVTLMGLGSVVAKAADIAGPVLAFHRALAAAALYVLVFVAVGGRISIASMKTAAPGGLIFGLQLCLFFSSIQLTTVANATMLIALQPVVILMFFSKRFGEPVTRREVFLSSIAFCGVGLVVFGSTASPSWSPLGDLLGVGALVTWTLYFVFSKQARKSLGALEYQGLSLLFSAAVLFPVALVFAGTLDPGPGKWWWIPAMVAVPGSGHMLMNWAHPRLKISLISEMTLLSPVVAVGVAALVLDGETVNAPQLTGMAIVLVALAVLVRQ